MHVHVEGLPREIVVEHDLAADKGFERECCQHVKTKAESCEVHHGVIGGEVVEHVAKRLVAKGEETGEGDKHAGEHGDAGGEVGYFAEAVDGRGFEGAINKEGVVVADKGCGCVVRSTVRLHMIVKVQRHNTKDIPNDITPIAWNMPELIVSSGVEKEPRAEDGVRIP